MYTVKKLSAMPYAQVHVEIFDSGDIALVSYTTVVVGVTKSGFVTVDGLYSMTTRRHISNFAKEYLYPLTYADLKKAYEKGYAINYLTGEIEYID